MTIQTERLTLKPLGLDYLLTAHEYSSDIENTKFMMFLPNDSLEETANFLLDCEREWQKEQPSYYEFAIILEGVHIGAVSLYLNDERTEAEFGWIINKAHWGKGYTLEAAKAALQFAVETLGIREFIAHCDSENAASERVMQKLGMSLAERNGGRKNHCSDEERIELKYAMTV